MFFKNIMHPCALVEINLSIGRVKDLLRDDWVLSYQYKYVFGVAEKGPTGKAG